MSLLVSRFSYILLFVHALMKIRYTLAQKSRINFISSGLVLCIYTLVKPALKYSSIDFIQSSMDVIINVDFFTSSSETSSFAFCSSCLGSLIFKSNTLSINEDLQNSVDLKALS